MGPLAEWKYSYRYVLYLYCICSSVSHFWIVSGLQLSTVQTIGELMVYYCPRFKPGQGIRSFDLRSLNLWSFNLFDLSIFSILSLFKKDPPWPNRSRQSFSKINRDQIALADLWKRLNRSNRSPKTRGLLKKMYFSLVVDYFPPFLCQKIESLSSRSICSCRSLKKSYRHRIDPVNLYKDRLWATWSRRSLQKINGRD